MEQTIGREPLPALTGPLQTNYITLGDIDVLMSM